MKVDTCVGSNKTPMIALTMLSNRSSQQRPNASKALAGRWTARVRARLSEKWPVRLGGAHVMIESPILDRLPITCSINRLLLNAVVKEISLEIASIISLIACYAADENCICLPSQSTTAASSTCLHINAHFLSVKASRASWRRG